VAGKDIQTLVGGGDHLICAVKSDRILLGIKWKEIIPVLLLLLLYSLTKEYNFPLCLLKNTCFLGMDSKTTVLVRIQLYSFAMFAGKYSRIHKKKILVVRVLIFYYYPPQTIKFFYLRKWNILDTYCIHFRKKKNTFLVVYKWP